MPNASDLPRAGNGQTVLLSADVYNTMRELLARFDNLSVAAPLYLQKDGAGLCIGARPPAVETALVLIIGPDAGGGKYKGSLLSGSSMEGSTNVPTTSTNAFAVTSADYTATGESIYQQEATGQTIPSDGFACQLDQDGNPVNNVLVCNLLEQGVQGNMIGLQSASGHSFTQLPDAAIVIGRIAGQTAESTPRTVVYVSQWNNRPGLAIITGQAYPGDAGSTSNNVYTGRLLCGSSAEYGAMFSEIVPNPPDTAAQDNAFITNLAATAYGGDAPTLPNNLVVPVTIYGNKYDPRSDPSSTRFWYFCATWILPQAPDVTVAEVMTTETADDNDYAGTGQTMLNNLKADVTNLQTELQQLIAGLLNSGVMSE